MNENLRKIIHVDMDAFFASVEQRDFPELRGKPIAVGGGENRGVVAAASYEARKYGVFSAMSSVIAKKKCPQLIFVPHRFSVYKEVSRQIRSIFKEYTDIIEPLSLDEAYLDVTHNFKNMAYATEIATEIRHRILETTGLTASAGISYNKFLAKTASDIQKPNGQFVIKPSAALGFLETLKIQKFYGIGKVTSQKMNMLGIFTGLDLKNQNLDFMKRHFGKSGQFFYDIVRGIDNRPVEPSREAKSISVENTLEIDFYNKREIAQYFEHILPTLERRTANLKPKTLTIKLKFSDFEQQTRSKTLLEGYYNLEIIKENIEPLLDLFTDIERGVRLIGVGVSGFKEEERTWGKQLTLSF